MILSCVPVGQLQANCYIVGCDTTKKAIVIDPGDEPEKILVRIESLGVQVGAIVNSHGHGDHIAANDCISASARVPVYIHDEDAPMLRDPAKNLSSMLGEGISCKSEIRSLSHGDVIGVGSLRFEVIHTPGHTRGGICLLCEDALFSGDTLFELSIGRHDLPGGSLADLEHSIKQRLFGLPDETRVFCGHGRATTIGREKRSNPFVGENARFRLR